MNAKRNRVETPVTAVDDLASMPMSHMVETCKRQAVVSDILAACRSRYGKGK